MLAAVAEQSNALKHAALWYAGLGYPVFPCAPSGKTPLTDNGLLAATTDEDTIAAWWARWPTANVAIRTDGLLVVDVDGAGNAWATEPKRWATLEGVPLATTPRGGRHYWFAQQAGRSWRNTAGRLAEHVDTRADGGYVLVPPSKVGGKPYEWADGRELTAPRHRLRPPPDWLTAAVDGLSAPSTAAVPAVAGNDIPAGQRNATLARLAGAMRRVGMTGDEIRVALFQVNADRCKPPASRPEVERIAASVARYEPDAISVALIEDHWGQDRTGQPVERPRQSAPVLAQLRDVQSERIRWLWPGRIALGKITLVVGDPGLGKSFVTLDLAARVSAGLPWPDLPLLPNTPGGVVLLSAEDDLADTIRPRLDAAGADVSRVVALKAVRRAGRDGVTESYPDLANDLEALEAAIEAVPDCRLVVVDPITAYLGATDSHNNSEVRAVLAKLFDLASLHKVAVLAVTHLNKASTLPAIYRAMGSLAFVAAARACWAVLRDEDDDTGRRRLFLAVKNNIGPDHEGLAYSLESAGDTARVVWESEPVSMRADDVMGGPGTPGPEATTRHEVEDWLRSALADGPRTAKDMTDEGVNGQGFNAKTIQRARVSIGVEAYRPENPGPWWWRLPTEKAEGQMVA